MLKFKHKKRISHFERKEFQEKNGSSPTKISVDFSAEILQARKEWYNISNVLKERKKKNQKKEARATNTGEISSRTEEEMKRSD